MSKLYLVFIFLCLDIFGAEANRQLPLTDNQLACYLRLKVWIIHAWPVSHQDIYGLIETFSTQEISEVLHCKSSTQETLIDSAHRVDLANRPLKNFLYAHETDIPFKGIVRMITAENLQQNDEEWGAFLKLFQHYLNAVSDLRQLDITFPYLNDLASSEPLLTIRINGLKMLLLSHYSKLIETNNLPDECNGQMRLALNRDIAILINANRGLHSLLVFEAISPSNIAEVPTSLTLELESEKVLSESIDTEEILVGLTKEPTLLPSKKRGRDNRSQVSSDSEDRPINCDSCRMSDKTGKLTKASLADGSRYFCRACYQRQAKKPELLCKDCGFVKYPKEGNFLKCPDCGGDHTHSAKGKTIFCGNCIKNHEPSAKKRRLDNQSL
jgi:hypothetical protein